MFICSMDITNESENLHVKQFKAMFQLRAVPMNQVTNSKQPLRICGVRGKGFLSLSLSQSPTMSSALVAFIVFGTDELSTLFNFNTL